MAKVDEEEDGEVAAIGSGRNSRRLLALIVGGTLVVLAAAGGGAYVFGLFDSVTGSEAATASDQEKQVAEAAPTFYPLPEMLVSLNTGERRSTFLKLKVSLELANPQDPSRIEQMLPRVVDYCQVFLRELRLEEIRGSAGTARLREELLRRIATAVAPIPVKDVLFSEIFIQ